MDNFSKITEMSLVNYFDILSLLGHTNNVIKKNTLVISFIEELLYDDINAFITEEDYKEIVKAINCLTENTCNIPFDSYQTFDDIRHEHNRRYTFRKTEDEILRASEDLHLRLVEQ